MKVNFFSEPYLLYEGIDFPERMHGEFVVDRKVGSARQGLNFFFTPIVIYTLKRAYYTEVFLES